MPESVTSVHDIRARRRRRLAVSSLLARSGGLAATAAAVLDWSHQPPGTPHTAALVTGGVVAIVVMLVTLVVSIAAFRLVARPAYRRLRTIEGTLDCGIITGAVVFFSALTANTSWPLLVIPILLAGYSRHTVGALGMWLLTAGSYAGGSWLLNGRLPADITMAAGLLLVIGVAAGTQGKAFARQVAELHAARAALSHQASHDALTGLANRSLLADQALVHAGRQVAVLVLDLNHFKRVNDSMGHAAGDELLRAVARRLTGCIGTRDVASRVGGDEFVVLLADATREEAAVAADRIRAALAEPVDLGGVAIPVQASIGIAHRGPDENTDLRTMTEQADLAMYADKSASRRTHLPVIAPATATATATATT